jgi:hypothetical protein
MTSSRPLGRICGIPVLIVVFVSLLFCGSCLARSGSSSITPFRVGMEYGGLENPKLTSKSPQFGSPPSESTNGARASLNTAQLFFERNDGQVDHEVMYISRTSRYSIFLTRTGLTVVMAQPGKDSDVLPANRCYFRLTFENANSQAQVAGTERLPGISNYFTGSDPKQWHTHIQQFAKVRYAQLYPGIDLIFYFRGGQLEYDLVGFPGANLTAVHFRIKGGSASLTRAGDAAIKIGGHEVVRWAKPHAYQEGSSTTAVTAHYSLHQDQLSFAVDHYDHMQPLVIDPALIFATYITSNCCNDQLNDIAADNTGIYLTGQTNASSFPATANGTTPTATQNYQTFVVKLDPTGSHILYSTFLSTSAGQAITVDGLGSAYVSGIAYMGSPAFPLTSGVFSGTVPTNAGLLPVGYATKLSPDGSTILYSTLLQQPTANGSFVSTPYVVSPSKIAVDSTGALYVGGISAPDGTIHDSQSVWMPLPVTVGAFGTTPGIGFVLKLNPNASGLGYATYIDGVGASHTSVAGIAVDSAGDAFVAGSSAGSNFPTTPGAYQTSGANNGYYFAFVTKLNATGTAQVYSTLFGSGDSNLQGFGLGVDPQGRAVLAGFAVGDLPVTSGTICGASPPPASAEQGFVTKFTADGSGLVYSTSVCTSGSSTSSVAVDSTGAAYIVGATQSAAQFAPVLLNPIQGYVPSTTNPVNILLKVDTSGSLQWSTFLGIEQSGSYPTTNKLAIDGTGAVYVLANSDIPPTANSIGPRSLAPGVPYNIETLDYLLKIAPSLGAPVPLTIPNQVSFGSENVGVPSTAVDVSVENFGDAPMSPGLSITGDFSEADNCNAGIPGGEKCDANVVFTPTATGNRTGALTISFSGNIPSQTVALSGIGTAPAVSLSPTTLSFGAQAIGTTSGQQQVTVTNSGTGPLTISSLQSTVQFAATSTCGAPVAAGSACTIQVTFTPSASGTQTGTLTITDNAANSPQTVSLTGNQPAGFSVTAPGGSASTSASVSAGQTATYNLSVSGTYGFSGGVNFTCSGAPANSKCSVTPNPANISSTSPVAVSVSVVTQAASSVFLRPEPPTSFPRPYAPLGIAVACALLLSCAFPLLANRRKFSYAAAAFALTFLTVAFAGCGGGSSSSSTGPTQPSNPGTAAGQYMLTVTGTSGPLSQSMNLSLTVK